MRVTLSPRKRMILAALARGTYVALPAHKRAMESLAKRGLVTELRSGRCPWRITWAGLEAIR